MRVPKILLPVLMIFLQAVAVCAADQTKPPTREQVDFFESRIRPVLVQHCYECHSAESKKIKGGLRLDHRAGLLAGGESGPAVVPGRPDESLLVDALKHEGLKMPPSGKLAEGVIRDFEHWVRMGLPDPRTTAAEMQSTPKAAKSVDIEAGRRHWAYQPLVEAEVPQVKDRAWPLGAIDQFLLARLETAGIKPVADADRYAWLRRVSFDLTGLPPTTAEIKAFLADQTPGAWQRVVERLLASPGFGERWARHWLDLTGYADQVGTSNNVFAEHAWRYRDYLIDSFNIDKPFDRFVKEQIAGDLLSWQTPRQRADNLVATGFLVLGDVEIVNLDKLQLEADQADLQVSKTGMVFLGQTLGCVRCHDHKFDPIGLQDYYALAGIFRSTHSVEKIDNGVWSGIPVARLPETAQASRASRMRGAEHDRQLAEMAQEKARLTERKTALAAELAKPGANTNALKKQDEQISRELKSLTARMEHARFFRPDQPRAFAVHDIAAPTDTKITIRGNARATGALVPRGMVRVVSWGPAAAIPAGQSGRLQLAEWLVDKNNPLTARVAVNRIWQKLFGEGLVRSVDYFGTRGDQPTHPELLDYLARQFMSQGWSQKILIKSIVLSHAYRLGNGPNEAAARIDPENRLIWRMNRQRLDAEALRDGMLAASGELRTLRGGPGLPLEFPENSSSLEPKAVNPPAFSLSKLRPEQEFQRTVYLPVVRSAQPEMTRVRDLFDFTQPAQIAGRRPQTVVPTQALYLLNNSLPRKRAAALASALLQLDQPANCRLEELWLRVFNRPITDSEMQDAMQFLAAFEMSEQNANAQRDTMAWTELCHALFCTNEFIFRP